MLQRKGKNARHSPYRKKISFAEIACFATERKWTSFAAFIVHHKRAVGIASTTLTMHH